MEPTPVPPEPHLVGRDAARRRIDSLLDGIRTHPEHLVIVGEAGIGKTAVWTYALEAARRRGYRTLSSRPGEEDWTRPNTLVGDVVADAPELAGAVRTATDQAAVAAALLAGVRELAADAPVVLAVDDLPFLDEASRRQLRFVLRRVSDLPVSLVATARTWDPAADAPDGPRPLPELRELPLGPLTPTELRGVLAGEWRELARPELERLHRDSGGNPLFALELARAGASGSPATVQAAVRARLARLPEAVRRVLELLAVGGPLPLSRLAAALGADAEGPVREAVAAHLAAIGADFTVRCVHPVVASAVAAALDPLARGGVHRRLLPGSSDPLERAVHLSRCTTTPDPDVAAELDEAAQLAARQGSSQLAEDLAGHAVRLTPEGDDRRDGRVVRHLGRLAACGRTGRALELADELIRELPAGAARSQLITLRVLLDFVGAEGYLRAALEAPGLDPPLRQLLTDLLGWQLGLFKGRLAEGLATSARAMVQAEQLGDPGRVARSAAILATTAMMAGAPQRELARQVATAAGGIDPGSTDLLGIWPAVLQARQSLWDGRIGEARVTLERMYRQAVELGSEFQRPYRLRDLAMLELYAGDPDRAAELLADGLDAARDAGNRQVEAWLALPAGQLAALRGDVAGADWAVRVLDAWAELTEEPPRRAMGLHIRGVVAAGRADWAAASDAYDQALALLDGLGVRHPGVFRVVPDAVVAAGSGGDLPRARRLATGLAGLVPELGSPWVSAWADAAAGVVALIEGGEGSAALLDGAITRLDGLGCRLDAVHLAWLRGLARLREGRRALARQELQEALAVVQAWGFDGWAVQLGRVLGRLGGDNDLLTPTEARLVALVRAGLRNREIAAELFVTESTVESHLTRIYRKLGVRNRAGLLATLA